jgi:hypothetical protein
MRFSVKEPAPCNAELRKEHGSNSGRTTLESGFLVAVLIAIEEDSGTALDASYGALSSTDDLVVWLRSGSDPVPRHLNEVSEIAEEDLPTPVGLQLRTGALDHIKNDDFVGACVSWRSCKSLAATWQLQAHLASQDRRNDWAISLLLSLRS